MKIETCVLLLTIATAVGGTNLNISFTQQHSRTGSKLSDLQNDQIKFKSTDSLEKHNYKNNKFARIQVDEKKFEVEFDNSSRVDSSVKPSHDATADYRSERAQSKEREGFFGSHSQNQQRSGYNPNREVHTLQGHLRNLSPQDKENIEFERYILNYHSGPTVETVYESAKPEMQHNFPVSSIKERSQRIVKFERQVSLPPKSDSVQLPNETIKPIISHQAAAPTSSSAPAIPSVSVGSTSANNFKVNPNQKPSSVGFDIHYNKPNYNDPTFKYKNEHADVHFHNQFPPSFEEQHKGYGDFYNNIYSRQQIMEQRPIVTKTIQIAQPAIKAKKYEVRHPAIQKEFYDIEERVVIKPAGTVVVELERPSAKILKEETTLPLGHPHPAVAAAYMQNRNTQTFSNIIYTNEGSSSPSHPNNQYIPQQAYLGSKSFNYDQNRKEINAEANQNKPFTSESQYSVSAADAPKQQSREIVVLTDGHGNQRQLPADQFSYNRDEKNETPARTVFNHRNSFDNERSNAQANIAPQRSGFQITHDNREDFSFDAEYISNSGNSNLRKESKPARLQDASSDRIIEQKQSLQPIIKHEHKIVLSPSQHNIYLSRNQEAPKTKFIEETAETHEIKPHFQKHRGSIHYVPVTQESELKYVQRAEYNTPARVLSQGAQYHEAPQRSKVFGTENRIQYSAPYAQMRHNSAEDDTQNERLHQTNFSSQRKSDNLIFEDTSMADVDTSLNEKRMEKELPQAHIEIKIPSSSSDSNKAIFVSSTIRPKMMNNANESHNSKLEISVTNNGEPKKEKILDDEVDKANESKNLSERESGNLSDTEIKPCSDDMSKATVSENYEITPKSQQKFLRIVEGASVTPSSNDASTSDEASTVKSNLQSHNVDINVKSSTGHLSPPVSRVIASTAAPKESNPNESFHKRRIVVNHPFQTVREVVEHEPYTNYHEVQVHEPATPDLYHSANYYRPQGSLRQSETHNLPAYYS